MKNNVIRLIITLGFGFIYFYVTLPPINFQNSDFLFFL